MSRSAIADLVRLPSVLTVPGDTLLGGAATGRPCGRVLLLPLSSAALYLAGMALNDYADREVDLRERPHRPIPSGRVTPRFALRLAFGLTGASLVTAVAADGMCSLRIALPLTAAVWAYDLSLKNGVLGPATMAFARGLDVLLGATHRGWRAALPAAGVIGAQTLVTTVVSRREVSGATGGLAAAASFANACVDAIAATLSVRRSVGGCRSVGGRGSAPRRTLAAALLGCHLALGARAGRIALREPTPGNVQNLVGTGVLGLILLQAGLLAPAAPGTALLVASGWPVARLLSRRRWVT